jgi:hydroxyacid-oxoacid transhydrogenase
MTNYEARSNVLMLATIAGVGFGNAGVHLPHGMSYPVSGMVREFVRKCYPEDNAIIPHDLSVIMHAPAVFRFTASTNTEQHLEAARLGNRRVGAGLDDAPKLDAGAMPQTHVIKSAPRPVTRGDLRQLIFDSMTLW